ncbi:MAG: hypothetical protein IJK02_08350 [Clostridia bacterium]|nr:hypothetical protein [Clostridia bacterium]MBR0538185.1 hypothetical protein [Clostridia bacterium]
MKRSFWNKPKKAAAVILSMLFLLGAAACEKEPEAPVETTSGTSSELTESTSLQGSITVPYTSLDSVNPFFADSLLNTSLTSLAFDALYYLDSGFTPVRLLAANETVTPQTIRVELLPDAVFSDGTPLTPADVIYSFRAAKTAPMYKTSLKNVASCEEAEGRAVVFTMSDPDVNACNLLTFPIVKTGTAEDEDSLPVGTGCYVFAKDELRLSFVANARRTLGVPSIGTVRLYDVTDASSLMHLLNTGEIDCYYTDLADGTAKRSYAGTGEVYLNNLVYLGVNADSYRLGTPDLRKAISAAISRSGVAQNAFLSHARSTLYPFNSSWDPLYASGDVPDARDSDPLGADAILKEMNAGTTGDTLHYTLVAREDLGFAANAAQQIARDLEAVNVDMQIRLLGEEDYKKALEEQAFDFYIGEIKLTKNMDLSAFFTPDGAAVYGMDLETLGVDEQYARYAAGEMELKDFLYAFSESMPFIPLVFRNGEFCYSNTVKSRVETTEERLFLNIADWQV